MPRCYDPNIAPDPEAWLELDEGERIFQAEKYHKKHGIRLPNVKAHAAFHAIVENQIAANEAAVVRAMHRLAGQGLDRHDCIHAIGWVLSQDLYARMNADTADSAEVMNARYFAAVERLNAADWLALKDDA